MNPGNAASPGKKPSAVRRPRAAVHHIQHQRAIVIRRRSIQVRHVSEALGRILRALRAIDKQLQRLTLAVVGEELQRKVNRLQEEALLSGKDGRDDVHELRHVGDLDDVRVIHERVQKRGAQQRMSRKDVFTVSD